jgi:hypothetical protein
MTIGEADGMGRELIQEDVRTGKKAIEERWNWIYLLKMLI